MARQPCEHGSCWRNGTSNRHAQGGHASGGELLWQKVIETGAHGMFAMILQHPDGGYVIAGSTFNGHDFDVFLVKADSEGNTRDQ